MADPNIPYKQCVRCKAEKPTSHFYKASNRRDGLYNYCKPCTRIDDHKRRKGDKRFYKTKQCGDCLLVKPRDAFYAKRGASDGLQGRCIECEKARTVRIGQTEKILPPERLCSKCREIKPLDQFHRDRAKTSGLAGRCKDCCTQYKLTLYGISVEEYENMKKAQKGLCAACGRRPPGTPKNVLAVDHCHTTGRVRALLCNTCNAAIGMLGDSPERAYKAWQYLLKHRQLALVS